MAVRIAILLLLIIVPSCTETDQSALYEIDDPNLVFDMGSSGFLGPNELKFRNVVAGQEIVQNSAIVMPEIGEEGRLVMAFRRSDFEEAFIQEFFFDKASRLLDLHPFAKRGVETVLTKDQVLITVHAGVNMHFRGDMETARDYRTFISSEVTGRVTEVQGNVKYSDDRATIRDRLEDVFTFTLYPGDYLRSIEGFRSKKLEDGSIIGELPPGFELPPKKYPPRVAVED